jgi:hypothetical protein
MQYHLQIRPLLTTRSILLPKQFLLRSLRIEISSQASQSQIRDRPRPRCIRGSIPWGSQTWQDPSGHVELVLGMRAVDPVRQFSVFGRPRSIYIRSSDIPVIQD